MGCAASAPLDTLPFKAHGRTSFSRCSTTERMNGEMFEKSLRNQAEQGHDVVLCYPLGGTVFGLELQACYEKVESVSLWTLDHFMSVPGTPIGISKSMSGGLRSEPALEIKPAPEAAAAAMTSSAALSLEIRMCRRGVVVLVTAGCTWDDGVLNCLRLAGKFLRPLVMVHCVQSCPMPALEEWPQDVRPLIAASGPPIKYLSQHSTEALREVEQRMVEATEALAAAAEAGAISKQQQQPQPEPKKQGSQPQALAPTATVESRRGSCLAGARWISPVSSWPPLAPPALSPQQQQQQLQVVQPLLRPAEATAATTSAATTSAAPPHDAASCAARGMLSPASSPSPLSLRALQASDSDICQRVSQLLGPWTCTGATAAAAAGSACSSVTLVEALVVSARPSCNGTSMATTAPEQQQQQHLGSSQRQGSAGGIQVPGYSAEVAPHGGPSVTTSCVPGGTRCVLRYRDRGWATPVAFMCAQLEAELGRANVSVQVAAVAAASTATLCSRRQMSPGLAMGSSVRLSPQSVDSGGNWSHKCRPHQQQQRTVFDAVAAAAVTVQGSERSTGDGSSSRCCSDSPTCGPRTEFVSESTSSRTSGHITPPIARTDDDLEPFTRPSVDNCTTPLLEAPTAAGSCSNNQRWPIGGGGNGSAAPPALGSVFWREEDSEQCQPQGTSEHGGSGGAGAAACLVYFVTPGLLAPLGCLAEVGAGLAQGRRILLVVDGECCQRLQDYAPAGMTPEVWKTVRRLWHQRLLYVPDYHIPFCALLKQGIIVATTTTAQS